jgi:hypothetical protein
MTYPIFPTIGDSRLSRRDRTVRPAPEPAAYAPADHTIPEVKQHVTDHPDELAAILEAEQARGDEARSTLTEWLMGRTDSDGG